MIVISSIVYTSINTLVENSGWVEHTHRVIGNGKQLEKLLVDMETGERGFLITGEAQFLEPYTRGKSEFNKLMSETKQLVSDNSLQVTRLKDIDAKVNAWIKKAASPEISMRNEMNNNTTTIDDVTALIEEKTGKHIFDNIREHFELFIETETQLLRERKADAGLLDASAVQLVEHTYKVIGKAKDLQKLLVDMETGERGFLITGKTEFLEPYTQGKLEFDKLVITTKKLVGDNPAQVAQLEKITALVKEWILKAATPEIAMRRKMNENTVTIKDVSSLIKKETGKNILDDLREMFDKFISTETKLLFEREQETENTAAQAIFTTIIGTIAAIIIGVIVSLLISRSLMTQIGGEPDIIADISQEVASGNIDISFQSPTVGITGIYASLINMINTFKNIADQADAIANGDFSGEITKKSDKDRLGNAIHKMKNQIAERTLAMEKSNRVIQGILDTAVDGIISISPEGIILTVNKATEKQFLYSSVELIGQKVNILMPEPYKAEHDGYLRTYRRTDIKKIIGVGREVVGLRKDGSTFPMFLSVGEIKQKEGVIYTGFIRDITKEKQFEEELKRSNAELVSQNEFKTQVTRVTELTQGVTDLQVMCDAIISTMAQITQSAHGVFYVTDSYSVNNNKLTLVGSYAAEKRKYNSVTINIGEGLLGQCAKDKQPILLTHAPENYVKIISALGKKEPNNIMIFPVLFEQHLMGAIELASFHEFSESHQNILEESAKSIGVAINNLNSQMKNKALLEESQQQAEELQTQQEELMSANESLINKV